MTRPLPEGGILVKSSSYIYRGVEKAGGKIVSSLGLGQGIWLNCYKY